MSEPDEMTVGKAVAVSTLTEAGKTYLQINGMDAVTASTVAAAAVSSVVEIPAALLRLRERRANRVVRLKRLMESYTARELDDLVAVAMDDEQKVEMLWRVVDTVQRTADERRFKAYAKLLADGLLTSNADETNVIARVVAGIAALDPPDLAVLNLMATRSRWFMRPTGQDSANPTSTVVQHFPGYDSILDAISARLDTGGMIRLGHESGGLTVGTAWSVTEFGKLCLQKLAEADALEMPAE